MAYFKKAPAKKQPLLSKETVAQGVAAGVLCTFIVRGIDAMVEATLAYWASAQEEAKARREAGGIIAAQLTGEQPAQEVTADATAESSLTDDVRASMEAFAKQHGVKNTHSMLDSTLQARCEEIRATQAASA